MWKPPKIWQNGTCWLIGGGPSILDQFGVPDDLKEALKWRQVDLSALSPFLSPLHNKHVIGVNMAYQLGNWIDFVFFGDSNWFLEHRDKLAEFDSFKVSCAPRFRYWPDNNVERIKFMEKNKEHNHGISTNPGYVSWNKNSGAASISLAVQLGAKRIVLLGFDMDMDENKNTHWFGCHWEKVGGPYGPRGDLKGKPSQSKAQRAKKAFKRGIEGFEAVAQDARKLGVEILNPNDQSRIQAFTKPDLETVLAEDRTGRE